MVQVFPFFSTIAFFFFFAMLLVPASGFGQSCYILETRDEVSRAEVFHFLVIRNDGSAELRTTFRDSSGLVHLFRSGLSDTSMTFGRERFLSPTEAPVVMKGEMSGHIPFRVKLELVQAEGDYYFRPVGMEVLRENTWKDIRSFTVYERSLNDLTQQPDLLRKFYSEADPFYVFLMDRRSRGPFQARNARLILVVVANTLDHNVGKSSARDMKNLTGLLTSFAEDTRMVMRSIVIHDKDFRKDKVLRVLDTLKTGRDDILFFYYTGHGFRYSDDTSKYPRLSMRYDTTLDYRTNNLRMEQDIFSKIAALRCKVKLIIADCCNTDIGVNAPVGGLPLMGTLMSKRAFSTMLNRRNADQLFFPGSPLTLLISSTGIDEKASGNPVLGGFFTSSFVAELKSALYGPVPGLTWDYVFAQARKNATYLALSSDCDDRKEVVQRCTQTPFARFIR